LQCAEFAYYLAFYLFYFLLDAGNIFLCLFADLNLTSFTAHSSNKNGFIRLVIHFSYFILHVLLFSVQVEGKIIAPYTSDLQVFLKGQEYT
jgi:hypothetical protein